MPGVMSDFTTEAWALLAIVALGGTLGILYTLARAFAHEQQVHDLKVRVTDLRRSYSRRLAEIGHAQAEGEGVIEAVPVDENP